MTAANDPNVAATVLFYGAYSPDFSKTKSKFLGHFAEVDEWEPLDGVKEMEQNLKNAGLDVTIHIYPGAAHWFMESDRPEYDSAAAQLAWDRTFEFLKQNLG
jgi:carboxymethylenebutenolidase